MNDKVFVATKCNNSADGGNIVTRSTVRFDQANIAVAVVPAGSDVADSGANIELLPNCLTVMSERRRVDHKQCESAVAMIDGAFAPGSTVRFRARDGIASPYRVIRLQPATQMQSSDGPGADP
jgi:hypothetical protein